MTESAREREQRLRQSYTKHAALAEHYRSEDRIRSLIHYFTSLVEDPRRDPIPFREVLAEGFRLHYISPPIDSFEALAAWVAGPLSSVVASTHAISDVVVTRLRRSRLLGNARHAIRSPVSRRQRHRKPQHPDLDRRRRRAASALRASRRSRSSASTFAGSERGAPHDGNPGARRGTRATRARFREPECLAPRAVLADRRRIAGAHEGARTAGPGWRSRRVCARPRASRRADRKSGGLSAERRAADNPRRPRSRSSR